MRIGKNLKLSVKTVDSENRVVTVGDLEVGSDLFIVIAGPCSVESREQILDVAREVKKAGAHMLRGGAFKPRTSPYSFQGLGVEGLKLLAEAREETGLPVVTEVMAPEQVRVVSEYADVLQIGARNMQNFPLLREVGRCRKPVLLKRGLWATVEEWLCAAEYIMVEGNLDVILCERGIRTFEKATRNTLDLSAVALLKHVSPLPVIVDPSHGTGVRELVPSMARASAAAGADGIMVEVHPRPEEALSDGPQSLRFEEFRRLMEGLRPVVEAVGRRV